MNMIEGKIYESIIKTRKQDFETALSIVEYILSEKDLKINLIQEFGSRIAKMQVLIRSRRFYEILNEIEQCDRILNQMDEFEKEEEREKRNF